MGELLTFPEVSARRVARRASPLGIVAETREADIEASRYFRMCRLCFDASLAVGDFREAFEQIEDILNYPLDPRASDDAPARRNALANRLLETMLTRWNDAPPLARVMQGDW